MSKRPFFIRPSAAVDENEKEVFQGFSFLLFLLLDLRFIRSEARSVSLTFHFRTDSREILFVVFYFRFSYEKKNSDDCKSFFSSKFVTLKKERNNFSSVFFYSKMFFFGSFSIFEMFFFQGEKEFHHRTELFLLDNFSSLPSGPNVHFSAKNVRKVIN